MTKLILVMTDSSIDQSNSKASQTSSDPHDKLHYPFDWSNYTVKAFDNYK